MNLRDLFNLSLVNRRDEIGLEWKGQEYTFGEMDARSDRMAESLVEQGLAQGDRLCVQLANCIELIDIYIACVKLGVIFVPINILYRDREVNHILNDAEPKLFITEPRASTSEQTVAYPTLDGDSPAALVYTSGTTGQAQSSPTTTSLRTR
jgi:malonyl-CoA/methylmalonyl-CoA synthetase